MKLDEMIQNLLKENPTYDNTKPAWADEILKELKEIKILIQKSNYNKKYYKTSPQKRDYYNFVNNLRKELKKEISNNVYTKIYYQKNYYGINKDGLLYNMHTLKELPTYKAYEIFEFLYNNRENLDKYIIKKKL
jgi:hypothetical protein